MDRSRFRLGSAALSCAILVSISGWLLVDAVVASDGTPVADGSRFRVEGTMKPVAVSACGRFTLDATLRFTPEARSADGRFAMKSVSVPLGECDPFPDPLFSDGFEELGP